MERYVFCRALERNLSRNPVQRTSKQGYGKQKKPHSTSRKNTESYHFLWIEKCEPSIERSAIDREVKSILATLGPDDHLLCAVKVPVGRLWMKTEVAKMERWERKAAVFPSFQNEIQRIAFQKNLLRESNRQGSFSGQRGARPVHLHNWRRLKCMWVTVTTVQWKPLFSSHVTHKGDPYRRLVWLSFFFFFLTPHSGLRCVLWKLEWCTPRRCRKVRLHGSQLQTPKKNLLKTWTSLPVRWDASSSIDKTTVEISKTIWTDSFCPSFNLLISKKKQQQQQIFKTQY